MVDDSQILRAGSYLRGGTYQIVRFISAGGFGCTYEAVHTGLSRRVAIKEFFVRDFCNRDPRNSQVSVATLSKKELAEKLLRKFLDEARNVARFNHPGVVKVIPFMVGYLITGKFVRRIRRRVREAEEN